MFSAQQGHYCYHFITSLVWRGPWLRIEPGTSRTRSQHYITRISGRRQKLVMKMPSHSNANSIISTSRMMW